MSFNQSYAHQSWEPVVLRKPGQGGAKPAGTGPKKPAGPASDVTVSKTVGAEYGKALTAARVARNLTRQQLATEMKIPLNTLAQYESGSAKADNAILQKIQGYFRKFNVVLPKTGPKKTGPTYGFDDEQGQ